MTLPRLVPEAAVQIKLSLDPAAGARPMGLILPCHAREISTPAFSNILDVLRKQVWLQQIVIGLDQATEADAAAVQLLTQDFEIPLQTLWFNGPEWVDLMPVPSGAHGKGLNVWRCLGWLLNHRPVEGIALHDCDIVGYEEELLIRLVHPIARPEFGVSFAKGYYARFTHQLHGRLTRLLFHPLVEVLRSRNNSAKLFSFLNAFRYPLAGEISLTTAFARKLRWPSGWALETGVLTEVAALCPPAERCQVELCGQYEHRHQPLAAASSVRTGLQISAQEIAHWLLREAGALAEAAPIAIAYERVAKEHAARYERVAWQNGLQVDAAAEATAVQLFAAAIRNAATAHLISLPPWEKGLLQSITH
jgi:glucosyl-3-phosphoglycerate synthase